MASLSVSLKWVIVVFGLPLAANGFQLQEVSDYGAQICLPPVNLLFTDICNGFFRLITLLFIGHFDLSLLCLDQGFSF